MMRSLGSTPIAENISAYLAIDSLLFFAVPLGVYFYIGRNREYCQSRKRSTEKSLGQERWDNPNSGYTSIPLRGSVRKTRPIVLPRKTRRGKSFDHYEC